MVKGVHLETRQEEAESEIEFEDDALEGLTSMEDES